VIVEALSTLVMEVYVAEGDFEADYSALTLVEPDEKVLEDEYGLTTFRTSLVGARLDHVTITLANTSTTDIVLREDMYVGEISTQCVTWNGEPDADDASPSDALELAEVGTSHPTKNSSIR